MSVRVSCKKRLSAPYLAAASAVWFAFVSASVLGFSGFIFTAQKAIAKPGQKEWILHQASDMGGATTIYVTDDAMKVKADKLSCYLICRAPDWRVHCIQPKESLEWVGKLSLFSGEVMANPYSLPELRKPVAMKCIGTGDFNGLKYSKHTVRDKGGALLYVADDIVLAPQAAEFLSRLYGMPLTSKVPVFCATKKAGAIVLVDRSSVKRNDYDVAADLRKGEVQHLRTLSWQFVPYNPADFAVPKNLKRVSDIIQVTFSSDKKDQLGDMLDNVGFTTKFDKKSGKNK